MSHHRRGLRRLLKDDDLAARVEANFEDAGLEARRLQMLRYAVKLTVSPSAVTPEDLAALKQLGFTDTDILHIAEVTAYYAYANRIAEGLGVSLEPHISQG